MPAAALVIVTASSVFPAERSGVVVDWVGPDGAAARGGLREGDVLVEWRRPAVPAAGAPAESGGLTSPFDFTMVRFNGAVLAPTTVRARRGTNLIEATPPLFWWQARVRPDLENRDLRALVRARAARSAEEIDRALARACALALRRGDCLRAPWFEFEAGRLGNAVGGASAGDRHADRGAALLHACAMPAEEHAALVVLGDMTGSVLTDKRSEVWYVEALELGVALSGDGMQVSRILQMLGNRAFKRYDPAPAAVALRFALAIHGRRGMTNGGGASMLISVGAVGSLRGDLDRAQRCYESALGIIEVVAPGSIDEAAVLNNMATIAGIRGDLDRAAELLGRAQVIRERLDPGGHTVALGLTNLGLLAMLRDDLPVAEELLQRAVKIMARNDWSRLDMTTGLITLAEVAIKRGDLDQAEEHLHEALGILESFAPNSSEAADAMVSLGLVEVERGNLERARDLYLRALEIEMEVRPDSMSVPAAVSRLGLLAWDSGDLDSARKYLTQAISRLRELQETGTHLASSLTNLGGVMIDLGELGEAEELCREALKLKQRMAPHSLAITPTLACLATTFARRGDFEAAETRYREAADIAGRLAPGTRRLASILHELGEVQRDRGLRQEALASFAGSVAALEEQQERLGGTAEQRGIFQSSMRDIYFDYLDLLLEEGRSEDAFAVSERSRAQGLLAMLAERDLVLAADISPELDQERRLLRGRAERLLDRLASVSGAEQTERALELELEDELQRVRREQNDLRARIRDASPRVAALTYPQPLDLSQVQAGLDPGTLMLAYALGPDQGWLFAVDRDEISVAPIDIGLEAVRRGVSARRLSLARPMARSAAPEVLDAAGLVGVAEQLTAARRLVLLPDGPLHLLPFAALGVPAEDGRTAYLVESLSLSTAASATVLAELQRGHQEYRPPHLVAFGDPAQAGPSGGDQRTGLELPPLEASRAEVERIGAMFGERAEVWLGAEASEQRARQVGADATIVHFACHGLVDERFPLESALALSPSAADQEAGENGLLQAWEIIESVRLDADLVTLSACDTALGKELAGEGIVGLTRAFQFAGARTVLASLWAVDDQSTAELMVRFYGGLERGLAKDEALRQAQLELIRGPVRVGEGSARVTRDLSHPYYWAPFQLVGDWR
jgi:CHAT domain-containing protein/Tfp pilus assembly protein PilF